MRPLLIQINSSFAGEKIRISPVGRNIKGYDKRVFNIDPQVVICNVNEYIADLMLDLEHSGGEAMGWFSKESLEAREDGIYATLNLTSKGEELVKGRLYRYLSPAYMAEERNGVYEVISIESIGLVNKPNLLGKALNSLSPAIDTLKNKNLELESRLREAMDLIESKSRDLEKMRALNKHALLDGLIAKGDLLPSRKDACLKADESTLELVLSAFKVEANAVLEKSKITLDKPDSGLPDSIKKQLGLKD